MRTIPLMLTIPLFSLAACGGGSEDTAVTKTITAGEGAMIEVGNTIVTVPAGAVSADTDVTLRMGDVDEFAALDSAVGQVFVFEPNVPLSESATLLLQPTEAIPADSSVQVMLFTDDVWIGQDFSTVVTQDGLVSSGTRALGPLVISVL